MIRIPKRFYDDHAERDLESPAILKETARHYWIAADQHLAELLSDADFYSDREHFPGYLGLVTSAIATARAITRYLDDHREQAIKDLTGRFERVDSDLNGNPRYVLHYLAFGSTYANACRRANAIGWRSKYTAKIHGACFVGQSYSLPDTARSIVEGNPHYSAITAAADQEAAA